MSTTHIAVGAVIGVGLARGLGALDLRVIGTIAVSWLITLLWGCFGCSVLLHFEDNFRIGNRRLNEYAPRACALILLCSVSA